MECARGHTPRTKQRLVRILIQEVLIDLDDLSHEAVVTIHWHGGRHTGLRVARARNGREPNDAHPSPNPVEVIRTLGGHWPDRELAVTMNRMRCKSPDGASWTVIRVRELRERLGIPEFDPATAAATICVAEAARRLQIGIGSVVSLIRAGILPAKQRLPSAPWEIPEEALETEAVQTGVRRIIERRPQNFDVLQERMNLRLPGF